VTDRSWPVLRKANALPRKDNLQKNGAGPRKNFGRVQPLSRHMSGGTPVSQCNSVQDSGNFGTIPGLPWTTDRYDQFAESLKKNFFFPLPRQGTISQKCWPAPLQRVQAGSSPVPGICSGHHPSHCNQSRLSLHGPTDRSCDRFAEAISKNPEETLFLVLFILKCFCENRKWNK